MSQSRPLFIGMDVHKETSAVAYIAQDHGAEVPSLGTMGTRQCDIDQLVRQMQSKAKHLIFVYAAGPWGSWLYRSLTNSDLQDAKRRLTACLLRHAIRSSGQATWNAAYLRWLAEVVWPTRRSQSSCKNISAPLLNTPNASSVSTRHSKRGAQPGASPLWLQPCRLCVASRAPWPRSVP
jgi:hypothetical protein